MTRAVIAVGANLGDRKSTVAHAVREIAELDDVHLVAVSAFIETPALTPHGVDESKPPYLNGVILVDTELDPVELLDHLNAIEDHHGRVRTEHWGNRTLDLDLIDFGGQRRMTERLTLPHPHAHEREFVLAPWLEVDPDAELPGRGRVEFVLAKLRGHL